MIIDNKNEREYRAIPCLSYSSIKDFATNRLQFYKKHVSKEKASKELSEDMIFGNLVDTLLFSEDDFSNRFIITMAKVTNGQMLTFAEELAKLTITNTNEHGELCTSLDNLINEAYSFVGFGRKGDTVEKIKEKFLKEKINYDYYEELVNKKNKAVIIAETLEYAQSLVSWIKNHKYTRDILNPSPSKTKIYHKQLMLEGEIRGIPIKMMGDLIEEDTSSMVVTPYDLKVGGNIESFAYQYLKLKYYIQEAVYTTLLRQHYEPLGYTVKPLKFIAIDKFRQVDPIIKSITEQQYFEAMNGFTTKFGKAYKGVDQLLIEIKWHQESQLWTSSKAQYENNGILPLDVDKWEESED